MAPIWSYSRAKLKKGGIVGAIKHSYLTKEW
jgi:hypothetical protein